MNLPFLAPLSSSGTMFLSTLFLEGLCPRSSMNSQFQILWPLLCPHPSWFSVTFLKIFLSKYALPLFPWKSILLRFLLPQWPFFDCFLPDLFNEVLPSRLSVFFLYSSHEQALPVGDTPQLFFSNPALSSDYLQTPLQQQVNVTAGWRGGTSKSVNKQYRPSSSPTRLLPTSPFIKGWMYPWQVYQCHLWGDSQTCSLWPIITTRLPLPSCTSDVPSGTPPACESGLPQLLSLQGHLNNTDRKIFLRITWMLTFTA